MMRRYAFALTLAALTALTRAVSADVGEPASAEITRLQSSHTFANVPSDHGSLPAQHLERWKFAVSSTESFIFTVDAKNVRAPVERETYVRMTSVDPYTLRPGENPGADDLRDVLSPNEYRDFERAAALTTVTETPLHVLAHFYRGRRAAYEVFEPMHRAYGSTDRFEWRSFRLDQLNRIIRAARACDNGDDCAAWY